MSQRIYQEIDKIFSETSVVLNKDEISANSKKYVYDILLFNHMRLGKYFCSRIDKIINKKNNQEL
jgi:hypothetical protein